MVGFIFGGDTKETPDSIKRKRDLVRALMGASNAPRNVGEGLNALGDGIVANVLDRRADKAEKTGLDSANAAFSSLFGGGASTSASPIPMTDAGSEVNTSNPAPVTAKGEIADYIRQAATARGIDPEVALRVAMSEGGLENPVNQSNYVKDGVREQSYGPFQLYMGGGLGNKALEAGIDPRDPAQWQKGVDFALDQAKTGGWGPWYGAKKIGITGMTGIGHAPQEVASAQPMTATDAIAAQSPQTPQTASISPAQALSAPPQQAAPQLPPPTNVAPAPQVAQATTQTPAQALAAGGPSMQQLIQASQNQFLTDGQRGVINALLKQKLDQQEADREMQMKRSDPAYQIGLKKSQLELDNLQNPRISPADQARIDLEKQKFDFERNKPKDPVRVSQGETLVDMGGKEIYKAAPKSEPKPSAVQEYEYAKKEGFPGTFQDWEASKKGGMSLQIDPETRAVTFQQGGNIKPMTEGQSKDAVFSTRAAGALPLIDKFGDSLTGMEGVTGRTVGQLPVVGNFAKSEGFQQAEQAGKEFLQAILRKDTGAAITPQETDEYGSVYLPRPGDSAELLKQKKVSRTRALEAIKAGMPPQAILAQEKALKNTAAATDDEPPPEGMDAQDWKFLTPEERKLFK